LRIWAPAPTRTVPVFLLHDPPEAGVYTGWFTEYFTEPDPPAMVSDVTAQ
jgi:hypothetical protein